MTIGTPGSTFHSPTLSQLELNTSFYSINVSGGSSERSELPVLSKPGGCLHAFTYQAVDGDHNGSTDISYSEFQERCEEAQGKLFNVSLLASVFKS